MFPRKQCQERYLHHEFSYVVLAALLTSALLSSTAWLIIAVDIVYLSLSLCLSLSLSLSIFFNHHFILSLTLLLLSRNSQFSSFFFLSLFAFSFYQWKEIVKLHVFAFFCDVDIFKFIFYYILYNSSFLMIAVEKKFLKPPIT